MSLSGSNVEMVQKLKICDNRIAPIANQIAIKVSIAKTVVATGDQNGF